MKIDLGWASVALLPSAPYSVRDASHRYVVGLAFERQRGVHAIGFDKRQDFDAWSEPAPVPGACENHLRNRPLALAECA